MLFVGQGKKQTQVFIYTQKCINSLPKYSMPYKVPFYYIVFLFLFLQLKCIFRERERESLGGGGGGGGGKGVAVGK